MRSEATNKNETVDSGTKKGQATFSCGISSSVTLIGKYFRLSPTVYPKKIFDLDFPVGGTVFCWYLASLST
jgi:hypothetical protein